MSTNEKNIFRKKHEAIRRDIKYQDKTFDFQSLEHAERVRSVKRFLKAIVGRVGCSDYLFTLGITELDERYGKSIVRELWEILDVYYEYADKINLDITRDDAFAAFYCLVHHYYRESDAAALKKLLMPKDDLIYKFSKENSVAVERLNFVTLSDSAYNEIFAGYPLIFELLARYYAVLGDYDSQFKMANTALRRLSGVKGVLYYKDEEPYEQQGVNYGVEISCASSVCSILEANYLYGVLSETPKRDFREEGRWEKSAYLCRNSVEKADMSTVLGFSDGEGMQVWERYIDGATDFAVNVLGNDYPKYHYLKAKIKFYNAVVSNFTSRDGQRELYEKDEIEAEIDKAVELEESRASHDVEKRTYAYKCLKDYVNGYVEANLDKKYHQDRRNIISAPNLSKLNGDAYPALRENVRGDYVFISYSSANFKPVYCDLLEMERKGINYWYDRGTCAGVDWKEVVRQRIKGCSVVLYYMSEQSVASAAVIDELNYILQLKKPVICINLCGNNVTSKTLISIIRDGSEKAVGSLSSNTFKTVCTACPDYIVMLQRDRDPLNVYHIKKLRGDLLKTFPSAIRFVESESRSEAGADKTYKTNSGKIAARPNEDYLICDDFNKIYIVADGISRTEREYADFLGGSGADSIARTVSEVFCNSLHSSLKEVILNAQSEDNLERDFISAFETANASVEKLLKTRTHYYLTRKYKSGTDYYEKPGCVAIAAFIFGGKLYYGSVGDCMGILIRGGRRIIFSDKQTDYAFTQLNVEDDRYRLCREYVNKPQNPYGYGVVNGDNNAVKFFAVSRFGLEAGDRIYIVSDGVSDLIKYGDADKIAKYSLEKIMRKEDERRASLGKRNDDKAIIRIKIN